MRKHPSHRLTARKYVTSIACRSYFLSLWGETLESRVLLATDGQWLDPEVAAIWSESVSNRTLDMSLRTRNLAAAAGFGDDSPDTAFDDTGVVRWIVQLTDDAAEQAGNPAAAAGFLADPSFPATIVRGLGAPGLVLVETECIPLATVRATLDANLHVEHFELDSAVRAEAAPNDPLFPQQFDLRNTGQNDATPGADIDAVEGWDVRHDASTVIVGVVDSGVDYTHPDLYLNIALLQGEIPPAVRAQLTDADGDGRISFSDLNQAANASQVTDRNATGYIDAGDLLADPAWEDGIDNDGNGFKDDLIGWDFVNNDNDPFDDHRHGTHVSGTIAARGDNGVGVSGIAWTAQILPLKFLDRNNSGDTSGAVEAIHYAAAQRGRGVDVRVLNASWGSHTYSQTLRTAIGTAGQAGELVVAAAGNGDALGRSVNVDLRPFYPASLDLPNILSVAASDQHDQLASFSNYGATAIDLAAPGMGVLSTEPGSGYQQRNGTSMATPHVTGTAALVWANIPTASAAEVRDAILTSVDPIPALQGKVGSGGRLNLGRALRADPIAPRVDHTSAPDLVTESSAAYRFTITYRDNIAVDAATLDDFDVLVTKVGDFSLSTTARLVSVSTPGDGSERSASYEIAPPGGTWDFADNGQYQLTLRPDQVRDSSQNAVTNGSLGLFRVNIPEPQPADVYVVSETVDSVDANPGDGSAVDSAGHRTLRAAVMEANAHAGLDAIRLPAGTFVFTFAGTDDTAAAGDLDVTESLTITGAGQDQTILDAADLDRVFHVLSGATLTLSKLTLREGSAATGAGILNAGNLSLSEVTVTRNDATTSGGGITTLAGASTTLTLSTISHNNAPTGAGLENRGTLSVVNTTVSDNRATETGGGLRNFSTGTATIDRSTFVGNAAATSGGGIANEGSLSVVNATLSTNSADTGGGLATSGTASLLNATIANNTAITSAGGISSTTTNTSVRNTIIATNTAPTAPDVSGSFTTGGNNLIGISNGATAFVNGTNADQVGTAGSPRPPGLAPLANYGGPTQTHALLPGSTAINAGSLDNAPRYDQRGGPRFIRYYSTSDDGPVQPESPRDSIGATEYGILFANDTVDSVDATPGDGLPFDSLGRASLRAAIQEANADPDYNIIIVGPGRFALTIPGANENNGATGDLDIRGELEIIGQGQDTTTIDAKELDRVIDIPYGSVAISYLTITGGLVAGDGGGIKGNVSGLYNAKITNNHATISHSTFGPSGRGGGIYGSGVIVSTSISHNTAFHGGGVYALSNALSIWNSSILSNSADLEGGSGGGIGSSAGARVYGTVIADNNAGSGGGISFASGIISESTISNNHAALNGGGVQILKTTTVSVSHDNTVIAHNTAGGIGGGVYAEGAATMKNTTVSDNSAFTYGGGYFAGPNTRLYSVTIYGNHSNGISPGVWIAAGVFQANNSVIAGNSGAQGAHDLGGEQVSDLYSVGNNFIGAGDLPRILDGVNGDLVGTTSSPFDAVLGPLQDNGGPTYTRLPRDGSPVIDAGFALSVQTDARGVARPQDGNGDGEVMADVGAVELMPGQTEQLSGTVFDDPSTLGFRIEMTAGLAERVVFLDFNANGLADLGEPFSSTDTDGRFLFEDISPKEYLVGVVGDVSRRVTSPNTVDLQASAAVTGGLHPGAVAAGDLNGDGALDLVWTSPGENRVFARQSTGPSTFGNLLEFTVGLEPRAVAIADLNGDARPEMVIANTVGNSLSVLVNLGGGAFGAALTVPVGIGPRDVVLVDIDNDRDLDLISADSGANTLSILRNQGDGMFAAAVSVAVPSSNATAPSPVAVAAADFDGDGDDDLAVANLNSFDVAIMANDSHGVFSWTRNLTVPNNKQGLPRAVVAADVNGDGKPDVVVVNSITDTATVFVSSGNLTFATGVNYSVGSKPVDVALQDIDADGDLDLLTLNETVNSVSLLLNSGSGVFATATHFATGSGPVSFITADMDRDGLSDVVTANATDGKVTLLRNIRGFHRVTVLPHDRFTGLDFGTQLLRAELSGSVYRDLDSDGTRDAEEPPIVGWTVFLDQNNNGVLDSGEATRQTDGSGVYSFVNLSPEVPYSVRQVVQAGWQSTTGLPYYAVRPAVGSSVGSLDFGNRALNGQIRGRAFRDDDRDGIQDAGEPPLADWRVFVDLNESGELDAGEPSAVTDANGDYTVTDLPALANYFVDEVPQAGWLKTYPEIQLDFNSATSKVGVGAPPWGAVAADFNNDGAVDLVARRDAASNLSFLPNSGDGTFSSAVTIPFSGRPTALVPADVDRDGDLDLIAGSDSSRVFTVFENVGGGQFTNRSTTTSADSQSVAVVDFDHDGDLDVVTGGRGISGNGVAELLLNDGTGRFPQATIIATNSQIYRSVAVGDWNLDGRVDVALTPANGNLEVLLGISSASFTPTITLNTPILDLLTPADMDADGDLDLVSAVTSTGVILLKNRGDGSFQLTTQSQSTSPKGLIVQDLNEDGDLDVLVLDSTTKQYAVQLGDGHLGLGVPQRFAYDSATSTTAYGLTAADFDGDGRLDVATANYSANEVAVHLNDSGPAVHRVTVGPGATVERNFGNREIDTVGGVDFSATISGVVFFDLDRDRFQDPEDLGRVGVTVFLDTDGDGVRDTGEPSTTTLADDPVTTSVNEAGRYRFADLVPGNYNVVEELPPDYELTTPNLASFQQSSKATGDGPRAIATGDLDGDGDSDLVVANAVTNDVSLLRNSGGVFADAVRIAAGFGPSSVTLGDWNRDGRLDLAVANYAGGNISLIRQNADGSFAAPTTLAAGVTPTSIVATDWDGDGDLDLAVTNEYLNKVTLLKNDGSGAFTTFGSPLTVGNSPQYLAVADVNGDARPDLLVANLKSRNVSLLRNTGGGTFAAAVNLGAGSEPISLTVADVTGDQVLDLIVANLASDDVSLLKGRGDGTFFPAIQFATDTGPTTVAAADFDRDGDRDLAVGNARSEKLSILLNNGSGDFSRSYTFGVADFPVSLPYAIATTDFNNDGLPDLALTNGRTDSVSVMLGNAAPGPYRVTLSSGQDLGGLNFGNRPPNQAPTDLSLSNASISESTSTTNGPASVGLLTAADGDDAAANHTFSLVSGTGASDNGRFVIQGNQLSVRQATVLDFESQPQYSIRVRVFDQVDTFEKVLTVQVTDVNEAPTNLALSNDSLAESVSTSTAAAIGSLSAVDPENATLTYALVVGQGDADNGSFQIDASTLKIRAGVPLDFETRSSYSVRVRVSDGTLNLEQPFVIHVTNVNESPTSISVSAMSILENVNTAAGAVTVGTLSATDPDASSTHTFSLVAGTGSTDNGKFQITGSTLRIRQGQLVNFESQASYAIRVEAFDGVNRYQQSLSISVTDANEPPTLIQLSNSNIAEDVDTSNAVTVGNLSATDPDANPVHTFSLVSGNGSEDNARFQVSGSVLQAKAGSGFDFESQSNYSVRVRVHDGVNGFEQSFQVHITNVNEPPTSLTLSNSTIDENTSTSGGNNPLGTLAASDPDANTTLSYSLVAGANDTDNGRFVIEGNTLKIAQGVTLDRETQASYSIRVRAADGQLGIERVFVVTVADVNEPPANLQLSNNSVIENTSTTNGLLVGGLTATDPDVNATLSYSLVAGTGSEDNGRFEVVGTNLRFLAGVSLNHEAQSTYAVRVQVSDGELTVQRPFLIQVTDLNEPPTNVTLSNTSIDENTSTSGGNIPLGTLAASDPDANTTLSYSLVAGANDTDNGRFVIEGNALKIAQGVTLDRETQASYSIRVRAADGQLGIERVFVVTVADVNEPPANLQLSNNSVIENTSTTNGLLVGGLTATDPDVNATLSYSLVAGTGSEDNGRFEVVGTNLRFLAGVSLNHEAQSTYAVRVQVSDGELTVQRPFLIQVTDLNEPPSNLQLSRTSLPENTDTSTGAVEVGRLSATDEDVPSSLSYSLVTGVGSDDNGSFVIEGDWLKFRAGTVLDFETQPNYQVRVRVSDGPNSVERSWTIALLDQNEPPTHFRWTNPSLQENIDTAAGPVALGRLMADDPDAGSVLSYALVAGAGSADNGQFTLVGDQLFLRQGAAVDFETQASYTIRARVSDGANSAQQVFSILVGDVNEPPGNLRLSNSAIPENTPTTTAATVGTLTAVDPDAGGTLTFTLVDGVGSTDNGLFQTSGSALQFRAGTILDFETQASYSLRVKVSDGALSSEQVFNVQLTDVDEAPYGFALSRNTVAENVDTAAGPVTIGTFSAQDPDGTATLTVTLVGGAGATDNGRFVLDGFELKLRQGTLVDFERQPSYSLRVRLSDGQNAFEQPFLIQVTDLNEPPTNLTLSNTSIDENTSTSGGNIPLGTLAASDPDANTTLSYSLVAGVGSDDNGSFVIEGDWLKFRAGTVLDFETQPNYQVRVRVSDGELFTDRVLSVEIKDVEETPTNHPPVAADDTGAATDEDTKIIVQAPGLLANDSDPDPTDTLAVIRFDTTSRLGAAVVVHEQGGWEYDPSAVMEFQVLGREQTINDDFTYTVSDGHGEAKTATVTVTVRGVNDWTNTGDSDDVNHDGFVTSIDALIVINELNNNGSRALPAQIGPPGKYYDTNGDHFLSPSDALKVINRVNAAFGEGESVDWLLIDLEDDTDNESWWDLLCAHATALGRPLAES